MKRGELDVALSDTALVKPIAVPWSKRSNQASRVNGINSRSRRSIDTGLRALA